MSCHNLNFKGISGKPRLLVANTHECIFSAIKLHHTEGVVKVIFMNTTDTINRDIPKLLPLSQRVVITILRALLHPYVDNERAEVFHALKSDKTISTLSELLFTLTSCAMKKSYLL